MKKVLVLCVCLIGILNADWKRVMGTSDSPLPPEKEVMKSDTLGVFIRTAVFGFNEQDTTVDNKDFKSIEIPEEPIDQDTINAGKPQIPYIRLLIAVPDSCGFDITVYESDYRLFENYLLYPVSSIVFEDSSGWMGSKEVYTYDASFYQKDTLYPDKFYEVISDGHWRDQRVLEVFLYPVQFNPGQELMYFYSGLDLRLEYSGEVVENENGLGPFEDIGREILLNYPGIDKEPESVPEPAVHYYTDLLDTNNVADYIIVTHAAFLGNEIDSFWIHEFAEWRVSHNQFDVGIVKMQDIYPQFPGTTPDSAAQLRDFLVYAYENWHANSMSDGHFAYCLFIGDWDYVRIETCFVYYFSTHPFNPWMNAYEGYFRNLNPPPDDIEDIMLGRWPASVIDPVLGSELGAIAQKTINYEQSPNLGDWRRRGLLIAGPGDGYNWFNSKVTQATSYFTDINYDTLTVRWHALCSLVVSPEIKFPDTVHTLLNYGEIIAAFYDHGGPLGWSYNYGTWYAEILENHEMLPVVLSYSCNSGMFQFDHPYYDTIPEPEWWARDTCFGECLLWNPDGGAVAFYGATSPICQYYTRPMERILRFQNWIIGKALVNTTSNTKNNCFCLLGDPALDLGDYTAYPDLPDLVVRPQGTDISLLSPYPYPAGGDEIPIRAKVYNIGGATAYNIDVKFEVVYAPNQTYTDIVIIEEIGPLDTAVATVYWNTALTHPDYYGEIGDCDFIVTVDPDDVITESWEYNNTSSIIKKVALYPYESGWPKKVTGFSQPAIANLDDTGPVEIVYANLDSIYVFNYDGSVVQGWPQYFEDVYAVVLGDIDNNGTIDIVGVSPEVINVYDYQGNVMSGWPQQIPYPDKTFKGYPALGYIKGSRKRQIVIFARTPGSWTPLQPKVLVYDYDGILLYDFNTSTMAYQCFSGGPAISDINGDGNEEIVLSYYYGVFEPLEEEEYVMTDIFNRTQNTPLLSLEYGSKYSISALVDLDNDGYAEVITGGDDKKIRAYKATTGQTLWERQTEGDINSSPAVGDIHPAPQYPGVEITFGNDASRVHLRWGINGDPIDPWPDTVGGQVNTSPAIANINGDKYLDIIVGANNGYIYAFKHTMERIVPYPLPLFGKPSSPVIGDIDGDKKSEVILSSTDGYLHVWENMDSKVLPYSLEWPQFHHDYQRTGLYGWVGGLRGGDANPKTFSTGATLSFTLEDNLHTKIKIYDAEANLVKTLVNQTLPQGTYNPVWFGKDDNYAFLPNGIYFIEIKVKNESKIISVEINR